MGFNTAKIGAKMKILKGDDSSMNEKLLLSAEDHDQKWIQKEFLFRSNRILAISFFVWLALAAIALIFSTSLSHFLSDKVDTKNTVVPSCKENRVVGYYAGDQDVTTEQLQKLTHIIFAHLKLDIKRVLKFESETSKERFLEMKKKAREVNKDLKVMISIGGWEQSAIFSQFWGSSFLMKNLMDAIVSFAKNYEIDGIELFWIHLNAYDKGKYLKFVQDLRKRFVNLGYKTPPLISIAVSPFRNVRANNYSWEDLVKEVEFINVLTYDYFNSWDSTFVGPTTPINGGDRENLHSTMKHISCQVGNPQKLNLVLPSYATYWTDVTLPFYENQFYWIIPERYNHNRSLYESKRETQRVSFRNLEVESKKWKDPEYHFHENSKSSYYWIPDSKTFFTLENEQSLREKVLYRNQWNIGGIGIMKIEEDDNGRTLLNVIANEKQCLTEKNYKILYDCQNIEFLEALSGFGNRHIVLPNGK